jgi:DNA-binding LytR/AlgR family response regulator
MIRCIIVDDEPLALDLLADNIKQIPFLELVGSCKNAMEALTMLQTTPVDLVFCDIQMPGLNGIKLVESLTVRPMFIFITAYEQFALQGYDLDLIDYLVKPVPFERFVKACNKAQERFVLKNATATEHNTLDTDFIFVHVDYSLVKIKVGEIRYIEALKDYVKIHFVDSIKKPLVVRMSMKNMEELLHQSFMLRIHKSFIINFTQVTAIRRNSIFLNDIELTVSDQYKDALSKLIGRQL